ncbi:uncharacterized mitochondrial protein-like protein [Tanacetum coccineum]
MAGYKHNQLKNKSFDDIQKLFDKAMKRVNTFVDMDTELVKGSAVRAEGSSKRAGEDLQQESTKKQKERSNHKEENILQLKRAEEKRNIPPTRSQQRSIMCTYLKNMEGWKPKSLKSKSFANIQELFDIAFKRVNTFIDYRTECKKLEEDKESKELKQCLEIIPYDGYDVTIDATPLSTKSPSIVDYKIYKEGKKSFFQIIKADVKARFKKTEPVNYMDNFLLLNLKTMFEHHVEDNNILYYLTAEKMYPLTNHTVHQMFNDVKLQVNYECEMAFELLRLVKKHLKEGYVPE